MIDLKQINGMIVDSIRNPQEGAATVLSMRPASDVLWMGLVLVAVLSTILSNLGLLFSTGDSAGIMMGPFSQTPLMMALVQVFFMGVMAGMVFWVGQAFGGTGSFAEGLVLVVWLQMIMVALQLLQLIVLPFAPLLSVLMAFAAVGLFFYLLTHFITVLHGFAAPGMVFAGIVVTGFVSMFLFGLILALIGVTPEAVAGPL